MYVISRQLGGATEWLISEALEGWGERDRAQWFETRTEARRVAVALKVSGDGSIQPTGNPLPKSE
jgi:hypothetical protein